MTKKTILYSLALMALGIYSYEATDRASVTALIPAFLGGVTFLCGLLSLSPRFTRHSMHTTVLLALIGMIGSFSGIPATIGHFTGTPAEKPAAAFSKATMFVLCAGYFVLCFMWFLSNRKKGKSPQVIA